MMDEERGFNENEVLPYNTEAEQTVLGAIMIDPSLITTAAAKLKPDSFYVQMHKDIFETLLDMFNASRPMEPLLILDELRNRGVFKEEDEKDYLLTMAQTASSVSNISYYVNIIEEKSALRNILKTCSEVSALCYKGGVKASDILDEAERRIYNITRGRQNVDLENLRDVVENEADRISELVTDTTGKFEPVKTGISSYDNIIGGMNKSDLVILAARPGMGKTALALNIAYNVAMSPRYNPKKSVVFFSLEMSSAQLAQRIISSACMIDHGVLQRGALSEDEWRLLVEFQKERLFGTRFLISDDSMASITDMKAKIRRVENVGLVVVDYLQLMGGNNPDRVREISEITRSFKIMAKEFDIPILLLSQLSRAISKRDDKTPQLSDLRDSGSIEQDADLVMFIDRPDASNPDAKRKNEADLYIQKNRHGQTGRLTLAWDGKHTTFRAIDTTIDE